MLNILGTVAGFVTKALEDRFKRKILKKLKKTFKKILRKIFGVALVGVALVLLFRHRRGVLAAILGK
jgi:threonine/homoserine/homoserine lactone efflux protein